MWYDAPDMEHIRNFCIIAHIDHGKSTLADRLLEITHTVEQREMKAQLLDSMDLEREKGITIKLQPVRMNYESAGTNYELNLIDTPGHVDFSYEVSRSLNACEGAILVVDASQGIQAQTLANVYMAIEAGLEIIPVLNKIDLPAAEPDRVTAEVCNLLGCKPEDVLRISAKTGEGVAEVLEAVVKTIPAPSGKPSDATRALIFDSHYDDYRGVILHVRLVDGEIVKAKELGLMGSKSETLAIEVGHFAPMQKADPKLECGQIGYIVTNLKSVSEARVGDTVTLRARPASEPLPGYRPSKSFVYAGLFPASADDHTDLKDGLEKLQLNDAALQFTPENSTVLGFGFRVGFLGLLHLDIIKERLEREYNVELIVTNPSTDYQVITQDGEEKTVRNASEMPDSTQILAIKEPWISGEVVVPKHLVGGVVELIVSVRGEQKGIEYIDDQLSIVRFQAPLATVLSDFYDELKSITSGYGSLSYELADYREQDLVRLDILVGGEMIDSLSMIVHRSESQRVGRRALEKLKEVIPRQLFEVSLQAAIGGKIIAREDVKALGKNVTGHLYGGDVSRKKKLWAKQKAGKARMKKFGKVDIPPEAFAVLLKK